MNLVCDLIMRLSFLVIPSPNKGNVKNEKGEEAPKIVLMTSMKCVGRTWTHETDGAAGAILLFFLLLFFFFFFFFFFFDRAAWRQHGKTWHLIKTKSDAH